MKHNESYEGKNFSDRDRKRFSLTCYKKEFNIINSEIVEKNIESSVDPYNALAIKKNKHNLPQVSYIDFVNCKNSLEDILKFTKQYGLLTENINIRTFDSETVTPKPFVVNTKEFITEQKKFECIVKLYTSLHTIIINPENSELDFSSSMFISLTNFFEEYNSNHPYINQIKLPLAARGRLDMLSKMLNFCNSSKDDILNLYSFKGKRLRKKFIKQGKGKHLENPYDELHSVIRKYPELIQKIETGNFENGLIIWTYCFDDARELVLEIVFNTIEEYVNQLKINLVPNQIKFDTVEYKGTLLSAMYFRFYFDIFMKQVGKTADKNSQATIPIRICRNNECKKVFVSYYRYNKHFCNPDCGQAYRYQLKKKTQSKE